MRILFLADAHLLSPDDRNYRALCRFLKELNGTVETLYIMGDLFDFWLGFPCSSFISPHEPLLQALDDLKNSGCRLVYFEGNHDFHLGTVFSNRLGAEIHTGPAIQEIQGKKVYLCHGDQINREDYGYRLLRMILHNRLTGSLVGIFPTKLALRIRDRLQEASRAGYKAKTARWDYAEMIRSMGRELERNGVDALVTGHFHIPFCETAVGSDFTILSLGDWMEQFTYGEMLDGKLVLKQYHPDSP